MRRSHSWRRPRTQHIHWLHYKATVMCWPEPLSASSPQPHHVLQHQGPHIYLYPCSSKFSCLHKVQRSTALTEEKVHGVVKHLKKGGPKWFNSQVSNTENKIKNRTWKTNPGNYAENIWYKDLFTNLGLMTNSSTEIQNEAPCSCPWSVGETSGQTDKSQSERRCQSEREQGL